MALSLISGPTVEPLTIAEARDQLNLGDSGGEPAPAAPTVALVAPAAAGSCNAGAWRVCFTTVTAEGESDPGPLSAAVVVADPAINGQIQITNISLGGAKATARKGYAVPPAGGNPKYFGTLANNTATAMVLNATAASLGAEAPTQNTTADPSVAAAIVDARTLFEVITGRQALLATWEQWLDRFPCGRDFIELPKPPLQSVTSVRYIDQDGVEQTWSNTKYLVSAPAGPTADRGRITLAYNESWPLIREQANAVKIRFVAGYGATSASIPGAVLRGIRVLVTEFYDQDGGAETMATAIRLFKPYKSRPSVQD